MGGIKSGFYLGIGLVLATGWTFWSSESTSTSPHLVSTIPSTSLATTANTSHYQSSPIINTYSLRSLTTDAQALTPSWIQLGPYIPNDDPHDETGFSVDLNHDGSRIIVGSPKNNGGGTFSGHARVFDYVSKSWKQVGNDIVGPEYYGMAGTSVGMNANGQRIILGIPFAQGEGGGGGYHSGLAQVYHLVHDTWLPLGPPIEGKSSKDYLGFAVDMNALGDRIVVGAHGTDTANGTDAGQAQVYEYYKGSWWPLGQALGGHNARDGLGESVALSDDGKRVILGSSNSDGNGLMSGQVQIWEYDHLFLHQWVQIGQVLHGEAVGDLFGASVDLSQNGKRIVVGARWNDGRGHYSGHARVFEEKDYEWVQVGEDINGEAAGDWSGRSVSMNHNGTLIAIGAPFNQGIGTEAGHVRVYAEEEGSPGTWTQKANDIDGEAPGDRFGSSVKMSSEGTRVIGGAIYHGAESGGHARVFELKLDKKVGPSPKSPGTPKWVVAVITVYSLAIGFLLTAFLFLFMKHKEQEEEEEE